MGELPIEADRAKFLHGSTMRHLVIMTASTAVGLFSIFAVDFINIFYLNRLGQVEISAAAGYSSTLFFFIISFGIGLAIATTALIAPALGAGDLHRAKRLSRHLHLFTFIVSAALSLIAWPFLGSLLQILGATGETNALATSYLRIVLPSTPFLTLGMVSAAVLRSTGDARRSASVTFGGAVVTAILDPIFIFALGLGIEGAAIASSLSRISLALIGLHGVIRIHNMIGPEERPMLLPDAIAILKIALPAVLTNLATPVANAYITAKIAFFGDEAVAGWAILGRLFPIAFVGLFALTGSVGPVLGQNLGAMLFDRVREVFANALKFTVYYTAAAWLVLALVYPWIGEAMKAKGLALDEIRFFCLWLSPLFAFMGALFVSNATFNNLSKPQFAAYLNWGRATLGTAPFVMVGAHLGGANGIISGQMAGGVLFGCLAVFLCFRYIGQLEAEAYASGKIPKLPIVPGGERPKTIADAGAM